MTWCFGLGFTQRLAACEMFAIQINKRGKAKLEWRQRVLWIDG